VSILPMPNRLSLPALPRLPAIRAPKLDLRLAARALAVGIVLGLVGIGVWAVGPANVVGGLIGAASREASVFLTLLTGGIGVALLASAILLTRGRPVWALTVGAAPLLALFALLVR